MWFLDALKDLGGNYLLMSAIIAWFMAQVIKIFTNLLEKISYLSKFKLNLYYKNTSLVFTVYE